MVERKLIKHTEKVIMRTEKIIKEQITMLEGRIAILTKRMESGEQAQLVHQQYTKFMGKLISLYWVMETPTKDRINKY